MFKVSGNDNPNRMGVLDLQLGQLQPWFAFDCCEPIHALILANNYPVHYCPPFLCLMAFTCVNSFVTTSSGMRRGPLSHISKPGNWVTEKVRLWCLQHGRYWQKVSFTHEPWLQGLISGCLSFQKVRGWWPSGTQWTACGPGVCLLVPGLFLGDIRASDRQCREVRLIFPLGTKRWACLTVANFPWPVSGKVAGI